jgi:hypothetical protein
MSLDNKLRTIAIALFDKDRLLVIIMLDDNCVRVGAYELR